MARLSVRLMSTSKPSTMSTEGTTTYTMLSAA